MQLLGKFGRIGRPKLKNGNIFRFFSDGNIPQDETTFSDEVWDKGIMNKDEPVPESSMRGHNEKFFKDFINLHLKGGHGGTGAVSFESAYKSHKKGSPCGGDGGVGGDIYLIANRDNPDFSYIKTKVSCVTLLIHVD